MIISKAKLEKIKEIIDKHYNKLVISTLGNKAFTDKELIALRAMGVDTSNQTSLLDLVYNHNYLNNPLTSVAPKNIKEMESQQSVSNTVDSPHSQNMKNSGSDKFKQLVDNLNSDVQTKFESTIRQDNQQLALDSFAVNRDQSIHDLMASSSIAKIKAKLQEISNGASKDWNRIVLTEMSNAIGLGSVDRIITNNPTKLPDTIYVFRIPVNDNVTCPYCRRFYNDRDGSPKLYRLSTLLANGTNYGKPTKDWLPIVGATHPNTRTSQIIELKPGFKLLPGGDIKYIGLDEWSNYIENKLES